MCPGQKDKIVCPYKENCYRFTAKSDKYGQSYIIDLPLKDHQCDHYSGKTGENRWSTKLTL